MRPHQFLRSLPFFFLTLIAFTVPSAAKTLGRDRADRAPDNSLSVKGSPGRPNYFLNVEYLTYDDALNEYEDRLDGLLPLEFTNQYDKKQPLGLRVGAMKKFGATETWEVGASVGYIEGPTLNYTSDAIPGTFFHPFTISGKVQTRFIRMMLETTKEFRLTRRIALKLGGAVGGGYGKISWRETWSSAGIPLALGEADKDWYDLSWEASPSLVIQFKKIDVEMGYKWAHFPQFKRSDDFYDFKWNPSIFYLGIIF